MALIAKYQILYNLIISRYLQTLKNVDNSI